MNLLLEDGRALDVRDDEHWLSCDGPADFAAPAELLAKTATLVPPLKLVLACGEARLRAEWPVDAGIDTAFAELTMALKLRAPDTSAAELLTLAQTAGWPATQRNETLCAIPLDGPDPATALLSACDGVVRASIEITDLTQAAPSCAEAVAVLLLDIAARVRGVRAVIAEGSAWIEAAFSTLPDAPALADGLAALSVAWRLAGREAALLARDEALATDFLSLRAEPAQQQETT